VIDDEFPEIGFSDTPPADPMETMAEGMRPLPEDTDMDRLVAAYELIGRMGASDFEVGFDDALPAETSWYASCWYPKAGPQSTFKWSSAHEAAERLARQLANGGRCTHCGRPVSLGASTLGPVSPVLAAGICRWTREGKAWVRGCIDTHEEGPRTAEAINDFIDRTGSPAIREE
jgi:hypothetical protein